VDKENLFVVPEGGANKHAVKGCMEILTNQDMRFDVIGCAVGTGGTLAGLIASAAKHQKVVGFQMVDDATIPDRIRTFVTRDNWELIRHPSHAGYAAADKRLVAFANKFFKKTGVLLDPIYTAPMLFQLVQMIKDDIWTFGTNLLLIHTGGIQGIAGFNSRAALQWPEV
jgi:1-aminocyclopropane-1-carboxylate deaminase